MLCSACHQQVASPRKGRYFERVLQALSPVDISRHHGERFDLQFGGIQSEQNGHCVVDAGVCVNDHSRLCNRVGQKKRKNERDEAKGGGESFHREVPLGKVIAQMTSIAAYRQLRLTSGWPWCPPT